MLENNCPLHPLGSYLARNSYPLPSDHLNAEHTDSISLEFLHTVKIHQLQPKMQSLDAHHLSPAGSPLKLSHSPSLPSAELPGTLHLLGGTQQERESYD